MKDSITYRELAKEEAELCRELCNALMAHQASKGTKYPEILAAMNFDNRLAPAVAAAKKGRLLGAFDGEKLVGYLFAEVITATEEAKTGRPPFSEGMAPEDAAGQGFLPPWLECPAAVGEIVNLYVMPEYRGKGAAQPLMDQGMAWLESDPEVKNILVYVSNGNDPAGFYARYGFRHCHEVLNGFITCYCKRVEKK